MNEEQLIAASLTVVPAPDGLWERIEERQRAGRRRSLMIGAAAAAALLLALFLPPRAKVVDLGPYLRPIQAADLGSSAGPLAAPLPGLRPVEAQASRRLPHLLLLAVYRRGSLDQAVYSRSDGSRVALFSAPLNVSFKYGKEVGFETEVDGIRCEKVDCPFQETYSFRAGGHRYVLVSKSSTPADAAEVMQSLGAAP